MRISDWSSDVCSSDLVAGGAELRFGTEAEAAPAGDVTVDCRGLAARDRLAELRGVRGEMLVLRSREVTLTRPVRLLHPRIPRSEERRFGKECVSTCRSRGAPDP